MRAADLLSELKRRRVFRVAGLYLVAGWAVIQGATSLVPAFDVPDWITRVVVLVVLLGFPLAVALAWAFDVTPEGIRRTGPASDGGEADAFGATVPTSGRGAAWLGVGILVALVGFGAYARFGGAAASDAESDPTSRSVASDPGADTLAEGVRSSVAVLPFVNMSGSADNEYFSDGITEEILNAVAKIPGLQVAGRTSSFAFKGKTGDLAEIARQLRVGNVLEGSVQRAGDRVRITAQLIDARTGYHVWSERYDRELKDVFAVEDEISRAIAAALEIRLVPGGPTLVARGTGDMLAYDLYLRGLAEWNGRTAESLTRAADYFQQAIDRDSTYARAYAGLALSYDLFDPYGAGTTDEFGPLAEAAARRALALDSTLADAHAALAWAVGYTRHDWSTALAEAERAVRLDPNGATAHNFYALLLTPFGRFAESRAQYERAAELDPLSIGIRVGFCIVLYNQRDYLGAMEQCDRVAEVPSRLPQEFLANIHLAQGHFDEAGASLVRWAELAGLPDAGKASRITAALAGRAPRAEAIALLRRWEAMPPQIANPYVLARLYLQLGEREAALDALDAAYAQRDVPLSFAAADPLLDPLRSEPRFQALLRRMNLPERLPGRSP